MTWTHFEFRSGANPYIAFTENHAKKQAAAWRRKGVIVEEVGDHRYKVYDRNDDPILVKLINGRYGFRRRGVTACRVDDLVLMPCWDHVPDFATRAEAWQYIEQALTDGNYIA